MNEIMTKLYYQLPPSLRSVVASFYGLSLRSWRYGKETEVLVAEALERDKWSPQRWRIWQEERLARVLYRAASKVPYYRNQWTERRRKGDQSSVERIEKWPLLDKEAVRRNPQAFVAEDCNLKKMFLDHTGGTTGTPLKLYSTKKTLRAWHAIFEARARRWNGLSRHERWATLGGQAIVRGDAKRPPYWVWNAPMRHLYLSANHISPANTPYYLNALMRYRVRHIIGYSSSLSVLAREALKLGAPRPSIRAIITMAEPLNRQQRDIIMTAFGCDIRETYGMSELVAMATECEAGTLHLWPEVGWLETFSDYEERPSAAGSTGRLIATSLMNTDMPLVRYVVGDRGKLDGENSYCECGRQLPAILGIEGRTNDLLLTKDGREVYWLNPIFYGLPVVEAQIIQERLDKVRVLYVPGLTFANNCEDVISNRLKTRMGDIHVTLERVISIPRGPNGKFRAVICNLSENERIAIRQNAAGKHGQRIGGFA